MPDMRAETAQAAHPRAQPHTHTVSLTHPLTHSSVVLTCSVHTQDSTTRNSFVSAVQLSPFSGWFTQAVPQGHFVPCVLGPRRFHRYGGLYACTASFFFSAKEEIPWTWEAAYGLDEHIEGTVVYLDAMLLEESCSFAPDEEVSAPFPVTSVHFPFPGC